MAKPKSKRQADKKQNARLRIKAAGHNLNEQIRTELKGHPSDMRGTSPGALGLVKQASEEARLVTCPECGYAAGRHSRMCSRKEQ